MGTMSTLTHKILYQLHYFLYYYRVLHYGPPYWLMIYCAIFALGCVILIGY